MLLALCEGNPPVIGGFPSQRASNAHNVSVSRRHHGAAILFWLELYSLSSALAIVHGDIVCHKLSLLLLGQYKGFHSISE